MFKISIEHDIEKINQWNFNVNLKTEYGDFKYKVIVEKDYYKEITKEKITPISLLEKSFIFLLDKESAKEILSEFNIKEINNYFSDYENYIKSII